MSPRARAHLACVLALAAAVAVAVWPVPLDPGGTLAGHAYGDLADHYWGTWWFGRELLAGRWPDTTNVSHYPDALNLWYVDALGALLVLPLRPLGQVWTWNLLVAGQLFAASLAGYVAGYRWTRDHAASLVAGVAAGVSPYAMGLVHSGLSEFLFVFPVVLFVPAALDAVAGRGRAWLVAAAWMAVAGTASPYYAIFCALFLLSAVPAPGWRDRLVAAVKVGALGGLGALPAALLSLRSLGGGGAVSAANAPGWTGHLPATDLLTFFMPGPYYFPDTPAAGNPGVLHVNYLGWLALALSAWGAWRARGTAEAPALGALLRAGGLYFAFAIGPRLAVAREIVSLGGVSVLLPLGFLSFPGSPIGMIHQPYRMVALLVPVLALGAAAGTARLPRAIRPLIAALLLLETLLVSPAPWPLATRPAPTATSYVGIDGPVLDWPPDASELNRDYLMAATVHGNPVPYGVNVFLPVSLREDPLVDGLLRALARVERRARNRDVGFTGRLLFNPSTPTTTLADKGFTAIVVHKRSLNDRELRRTQALLGAAFGAPVRDDTELAVWATVPAP